MENTTELLEQATETAASAVTHFEPMNFIQNLTYMAKGMLGIFVVIAVIILFIYILNGLTTKKSK